MADSVSTAESVLSNQARAANAPGWISVRAYDVQTLLATVRSLRSRLESAERDTARIEWLESHAGLVAGDLTPETPCRDAAFGWVKIPRFDDPQRALRDAIDAAQPPSSNQGKTND